MKQKVLSIIVPTYNMERFLSRCLETIISDKTKEDIEIVIVNDGSKDNSSKIAHTYEEEYPETIIVIDKENGGYGSTLNTGINNASGKYLKICDSDDWFDLNSFELFVKQLQNEDSDIIYNSYSKEYLNNKSEIMKSPFIGNVTYNKSLLFEDLELERLLCLPEITYKTNLLKNKNFKFQEKTFYVDLEYITFPILEIKSITLMPYCIYKYFIGREGQSISYESKEKNIDSLERVVSSLIEFYIINRVELSLSPLKQALIKNNIVEVVTTIFCVYILSFKGRRKWALNQLTFKLKNLKNNYPDIYNGVINNKQKSAIIVNAYLKIPLLFYIFPFIYDVIRYLKRI